MRKMANLTAVETVTEKDPAAAAFIVKTTQYFVPMAGKIDVEAENRETRRTSLAYYEGFLASGHEEALERALRRSRRLKRWS